MNPKIAREKLTLFLESLPDNVFFALQDKNIDPGLLTTDITSAHEFAIRETGNICTGVLSVLKGEGSAGNLISFIQQDKNIGEDNLPKIPELAYEIQTKLFDPVLPILKQAGFPIKEGRVPLPPVKSEVLSSKFEVTTPGLADMPAPSTARQAGSATPFTKGDRDTSALPPLEEEKNMRALLRIAAGTTYSETDLRNAFEELPQGLRQSLSSVDTANAIQDIAKKYLLHVDQMASLASETGLVLLGLTHPADFIGNLTKRLRTPEEQSRNIARDISAQILTKVREALRGLHEAPPASSFQVSGSSQETGARFQVLGSSNTSSKALPPLEANSYKLKASSAEPLQKMNVMPQRKNIEVPNSELKADMQTPYSAGAKWNTGENVLSKQTDTARPAEEEEPLSRANVLRDIENPQSIKREVVGPTGWKPATSDGGKSQVSSFKFQGSRPTPPQSIPVSTPKAPLMPTLAPKPLTAPSSLPTVQVPSFVSGKSRPTEHTVTPPSPKPQTEPQDFLSQKLQAPMNVPSDERRYTTDPYREPLDS